MFTQIKVKGKLFCPVNWKFVLCFTPHAAAARAAPMAGKVTFMIYTLFPTVPIIIGSYHYIFVFVTLDS